jgi:hypothetical protein
MKLLMSDGNGVEVTHESSMQLHNAGLVLAAGPASSSKRGSLMSLFLKTDNIN